MGKLTENILSLLQLQYSHEMANHFRYLARASWARYRGLEGAGDFFAKEAQGEFEHAGKVQKYIEDRSEALVPEIVFTAEPDFETFEALFVSALEVERDTTAKLENIFAESMRLADFMSAVWIQALISEQIEEENTLQTILDRIRIRAGGGKPLDPCGVHDLDVWIGGRK